jgi:erythromycin esterase
MARKDSVVACNRLREWALRGRAVLNWGSARARQESLAKLDEIVGDTRIVCLSEAVHGAKETLELRNRVFQYLVTKKNFTAIALESGIVEGRLLYDYVRGSTDLSRSRALARGLSWTFEKLPQNGALIDWIRSHNRSNSSAKRSVNFYGFDLPGSPGNPIPKTGVNTALEYVLSFLERVDPKTASDYRRQLSSVLPLIRCDPDDIKQPDFRELTSQKRQLLSITVSNLAEHLRKRRALYGRAAWISEYRWAAQAAINAERIDSWLNAFYDKTVPQRALSQRELITREARASNIRDRSQADNVAWILDREGADGKVLLFAHRFHVSKAPVWVGAFNTSVAHLPMGTHLRRRFPRDLTVIGSLVGSGAAACGSVSIALNGPISGSLDELAGKLGRSAYVLDLRSVPKSIASRIGREHLLGHNSPELGDLTLRLDATRAFDAVVYQHRVSEAS